MSQEEQDKFGVARSLVLAVFGKDGEDCPACDGTGSIPYDDDDGDGWRACECSECDGTGRVKP